MNEHELSRTGERRKAEIGAMLAARARQRRVGRRVLGGAGCALLLLAGVIFVSRHGQTRETPARELIVERSNNGGELPRPSVEIAVQEKPSLARVRIVTNDPLPTTKCDGVGPTSSRAVSVCLLDDSQLLAALTQTGQSYGLVKMGGKTRVVVNSGQQ